MSEKIKDLIFISLGDNCVPKLALEGLNIKQETFPFDRNRSNSKIIYDVLLNGTDKFLSFEESDNRIVLNLFVDKFAKEFYKFKKPLDIINFKKQNSIISEDTLSHLDLEITKNICKIARNLKKNGELNKDKFNSFKYLNYYGQIFHHYNNISVTELIEMYQRRFKNFFNLLKNSKKKYYLYNQMKEIYIILIKLMKKTIHTYVKLTIF